MTIFYSGYSGTPVGAFFPYSIAILIGVLAAFHLKRFLLFPAFFARVRNLSS